MALKKTGVRLVAEDSAGFLGALNKANKAVSDLGTAGAATGNIGLIALSAGIAAVAFAVTKALQLVVDFTQKIIELGKQSIITAARWDELRLTAQLLGQRAGLTADEVDSLANSIEEQGIRADVASTLIAQFARYNLDLAQATELAAAAQNVAVLAGQDSSETLDNLIYGITTYNKRVLRTQGLNIDVEGSFRTLEKELDKTKDSLTETEKVQATLNAVLIESSKLTGIYDLAMENAGKQLRSLTGRELPELSAAFGQFFQPAFLTAVKAARQFVSGLKDAISEGGRLYPVMVRIGAIASLIADGLAKLAGVAEEAGISFVEKLGNKLAQAAENALRWGVNIAVNLADGLIKGAASAIIAAMNFISNLLTSWLAPGSPPKVAPDIIKWGKSTMEEYIKGWSLADFSFFKGVTNIIESYIRSLPGLIGDKAVNIIPRILGTRKAVAEAIASMQRTGQVTEEAINKIVKSIGGATGAFREYIRAYFSAEAATMAVTKAQEELAKVSDRVKMIQTEINDITSKYDEKLKALNKQLGRQGEILDENQRLAKIQSALASGLLTDEEKARLEAEKSDINTRQQIRTLEDQRDAELAVANTRLMAAQEEQKAVEARLAQLEAQQATAQEYLALQEAIIQTQIDQNNLIKSQMELLKRLADAAKEGGDIGDTFAGLSGSFEAARNRIYEAIEEMKQRIIDTFFEITAPLRDKWVNEWQPIIDDVKKKWDRFEIDILTIWYRLFGPERGIITTTFKSAGDKIAEVWEDTIWPAMKSVYNWMLNDLQPFIEGLNELIGAVWVKSIELVSDAWEILLDNYLKPLWSFLSDTFGPYIENTLIPKVLNPLKTIIDNIWGAVKNVLGSFGDFGDTLKNVADKIKNLPKLSDYIHKSPSPLEAGLSAINKQMRQLSQIEMPRLATSLGSIQHQQPAWAMSRTVNQMSDSHNTEINVNAAYARTQSQASIYYDVVAALQAAKL